MREFLPMRRLLQELGERIKLDLERDGKLHSVIFEENNGALALAKAPKLTPRTKYIAVKYHFFKDHIGEDKRIKIIKIESEYQKADIFTKGLPMVDFERTCGLMMG